MARLVADPDTLLRDGDLAGARAALIETIRSRPADQEARMFLFQLFAVIGEWDKASAQLDVLAQLSPEAQMLRLTYQQAIAAERQRAAAFSGEQDAVLLVGSGGWAEGIARAHSCLARGDGEGARAARDEAFDQASDLLGVLDGVRFEWIADADSRFGPTFEAIIGGSYGLVPFDQVVSLTSEGPRDLRDTVWYPAQIALRGGQSVAALLPARYPGSESSPNDAERLGRVTGWSQGLLGQVGLGQRLWAVSDGQDRGLLDVRELTFD